ncbi:MAG TPA: ABC transporter permease subunit [Tepidisphaeraceae bacterium]|nr:ABC transporter permease subunit [Tepidisphaeraceae bacterium]
MYRTFVILRHTFFETVVQPIYTLLVGLGVAILVIFALLPFFTLGEDTVMYKAVGLDVILLVVLLATLFATSRSIYEEIEDRTMLTLMSKPVRKWQVLVGKYLGIIAAALLAIAILGTVFMLATYWRLPGDYQLRMNTLDERDLRRAFEMRYMHLYGLVPSLLLVWLQVGVLASISVALSTRFSLVVNLPTVILLYIAGNLTRFLFPMTGPGGTLADSSPLTRGVAYVGSLVLPYLETFDLRQFTVYAPIALPGTEYTENPLAIAPGTIWGMFGVSAVYGIAYAVFALAVGLWLFQNRELGGAEG